MLYKIPDYKVDAVNAMKSAAESTGAMSKTRTRETTGPGKTAGGALGNAAGGAIAGYQMGKMYDEYKSSPNTKMGAPNKAGSTKMGAPGKTGASSGGKWGAGIGAVLGLLSYIL